MTSVSVVIPTCARPMPLRRALESVRSQQTAPREIIVVDDGDPRDAEHVRHIVQAAGIDGVRVIANAGTKGPSSARNTGAAQAAGSLLAFLDDDDEWLPSYLGTVVHRCDAGGIDVMCTDLLYRDDDGTERPGKTAPDALHSDAFLTRNPGLIGSNLIISRALFNALAGFDESLQTLEDMDFGFRLSGHPGVRYARLPERLVRHHQHTETRLCTRRGDAMRAGVRRFFELYGPRMDETQRDQFRHLVRRLWSVDEYGQTASLAESMAPPQS